MAMRCFGRAFGLALAAGALRALDLMALRAEVFAEVPSPDHFFFTAVLAAALDAGFLAIVASLIDYGGRVNKVFALLRFFGWAKARLRRAPQMHPRLGWWARLRFAHPPDQLN